MRFKQTLWLGVGLVAALSVGFASGRAQEAKRGQIVGVYGVAGVVTADGQLYQYFPDGRGWITIDEAFKSDGHDTRILPLPVHVEDIQFMESFGFLVTKKGVAWHYDIENHTWQNIGTP